MSKLEIIQTTVREATSIREMVDKMTGKRRIGLVYFQKLSNGAFVARTLSEATEKGFLLQGIENRIIYLPIEIIIAETQ